MVSNPVRLLFMKLLTGRAQIFADVRTYWSGDAIKRVTGYEIEGKAKEADGFFHVAPLKITLILLPNQ